MIAFTNNYRAQYGVESICRLLSIAPSSYYCHKHLERYPEKRSERLKREGKFKTGITRVYEESNSVSGARKVWKQFHRESI